jgi:chorismate mutase
MDGDWVRRAGRAGGAGTAEGAEMDGDCAGEAGRAGDAGPATTAGRIGRADDGSARAARLETLVQHRGCIDRIDRTIIALLTERIRLGLALGDIKRDLRLPSRSESREAEVLAHVRQAAAGPLSSKSAERIFSAIIAETSAAQDGGHD